MPSRVFNSVFGELQPNADTSRSPRRSLDFSTIRPLNERLQEKWAKGVPRRDALVLLRDTVARFQQIQQDHRDSIAAQAKDKEDVEDAKRNLHALHALFSNSVPRDAYVDVLAFVLHEIGYRLIDTADKLGKSTIRGFPEDSSKLQSFLFSLIQNLSAVGLAGVQAERAYAQAADKLLRNFVHMSVRNVFADSNDDSRIRECPILRLEWDIMQVFGPLLKRWMSPLDSLSSSTFGLDFGRRFAEDVDPHKFWRAKTLARIYQGDESRAGLRNLCAWVDRARDVLGEIRSKQIYNIIVSKDQAFRQAGLADIKELCNTPAGRRKMSLALSAQLQRRLLLPGSSTVDVLDVYLLIIYTLGQDLPTIGRIDPSGILLDRAAKPIRVFLANREDAARIVILSLLEPNAESQSEGGQLSKDNAPSWLEMAPLPSGENFSGFVSHAMLCAKKGLQTPRSYKGDDLNLRWKPEPIDALAGHKELASMDAIGHITTICSPDTFIEELERLLGERLLKTNQTSFLNEMDLLRMFQSRFAVSQIQGSEVMLYDMIDSTRWNERIKSTQAETGSSLDGAALEFQARIISHVYWRALKWESFQLPPAMNKLLESYETSFGDMQFSRRLDWVKQLGQVAVEIELTDRTFEGEVTPPQAAVIYLFCDEESSAAQPATRTVASIIEDLKMEEALVRACLNFWTSKMIIRESPSSPDTFVVLETLSPGERDARASTAITVEPDRDEPPSLKTQADLLAEHAETYSAYIVGMLTNQGAMPAQRVHMMLKMVAPGGFSFELEDLVRLMQEMAENGKIERAGPLWKIIQPQQKQEKEEEQDNEEQEN